MDAIALLTADHRTVEQLFKRYEKSGERAYVQKRSIVDRIIEELSVHAAIEEQLLYPVARKAVPAAEDITLESLEEHHIVKWVLSELAGMDPQHERFDAKVTVLMENVRHHIREEEGELFPKVRNQLSRAALDELGDALAKAKKTAPTHPHPRSPDDAPSNAVVGALAGVVDRLGDNVSGFTQGGVTALQDLIARITGGDRPKSSPTGTSAARGRANDVRSSATRATDGAQEAVRSAKAVGTATVRTATAGAKATATTAKKSASATKTAAKRAATSTSRTAKAQAKKAASNTKRAASKPKRPATTSV